MKFFAVGLKRPVISRRAALVLMAMTAIFVSALLMRLFPARYGYFLNEFDPFFDYKATRYIVDGVVQRGFGGLFGPEGYFSWVDKQSWYPEGRAVASTSQVGLHLGGAALYLFTRYLLGVQVTLYDFLVAFPVVFGSISTVIVFLLGQRFGGVGGGLLSALVFALSPPIIQRGNLGWFKSEPFALFLALLATYAFLTALDSRSSNARTLTRSAAAGLLFGLAVASWGGAQLFMGVLALFLLAAPFYRVEPARLVRAGTVLGSLLLLVLASLPRPGPGAILNPGGLLLLFSLAFNVVLVIGEGGAQARSPVSSATRAVYTLILLGLFLGGFGVASSLSLRYYSVVNPLQRGQNALVESVAEHFVPTGAEFFFDYGALLFLAVIGAATALRRRGVEAAFLLVLGLAGLYVSASFSRLLVFSSISVALLAAAGLREVTSALFSPGPVSALRKKGRIGGFGTEARVVGSIFLILLLTFAAYAPALRGSPSGWIPAADLPTSLSVAGLPFNVREPITDWIEALDWIRKNTPPDAVIASWWDYGYWITVMANRTSLIDNATLNQTKIALVGRAFMSEEADGIRILRDQLRADYVVVFVAATRVSENPTLYSFERDPFGLNTLGGDGSKMQWFARIPGLDVRQYLSDRGLPTDYFWEKTLLGKLFPFQPDKAQNEAYVDQLRRRFGIAADVQIVTYSIKYPAEAAGPLQLSFKSSFKIGPSSIGVQVLVYKIVR